jgi:hypothetical protein
MGKLLRVIGDFLITTLGHLLGHFGLLGHGGILSQTGSGIKVDQKFRKPELSRWGA